MNHFKIIILLISITVVSQNLIGDKPPKFGKVSEEELRMTSIPEDPEADAVFLFESGDVNIDLDGSEYWMTFEYHGRIKILTEEGKKHADFKIPYWHEDKIDKIKAHTVLQNGKKIKLKGDNIFEEREGDWKYKTFAIPGVEVGSAIEVYYKKRTQYLHFLPPWYFQNNEFTKYSQYSVMVYPRFSYYAFFRNTYEIKPSIEKIFVPGEKIQRNKYTWIMENLPPIREEPYMRTLEDYRASIHFQIQEYKDPYQYYKFIKSWPDMVKKMRDYYEDYLNEDKELKEIVEQNLADTLNNEQKIEALYNYARDNIATEERGDKYIDKKLKDILKELSATGAEKNILLVNLLTLAGFEANPLLISTRNHGFISKEQPRLEQFNYVLAHVVNGYKSYIFDTREKYCPSNLLPTDDLGDIGLLINKGEGKFIKIPEPRGINILYCNTSSTINETGDLNCESEIRFEGYRALRKRTELSRTDEKEFVEDLLSDRFGEIELLDYKISHAEDTKVPLLISARYHVPGYAQVVGDMIYLNAPIFENIEDNPFKRLERYFPVEFPSILASTEQIKIDIPDGFEIKEIPRPVILRPQDFKISFVNQWKKEGNSVEMNQNFLRRDLYIKPSLYKALRNLYDEIVAAEKGQIVIGAETAQLEVSK